MVSIFSSDSDSDSDMEVLAQLSDWDGTDTDIEIKDELRRASPQRPKRVNYMQSLDDADFTFRFRLSKSAVNSLLTEIMPLVRVTSSRNNGVSPLHQLLLTLRFYALGTMLISVADFVGVSKSTAGRIVRDISEAIAHLYDKYVFMHSGTADIFYDIAQFPQVLGAIDCTHVRIQSPSRFTGEEFRNRKGYYSLKVQAVCDANLMLMNIVARWPGSAHAATIFNNSALRAQCDAGLFDGHWLLGDSAYPNRPYLLTPVINPRNQAELHYNEAHVQTRNTIELTFDIWKTRFPVVALTLRVSLPVAQAIIIATGVLHNICRSNNIADVAPEVDVGSNNVTSQEHIENYELMEAQDISARDELLNNYFGQNIQ